MKDSWVKETWMEEGFLIAGGVGPGEVSGGETSESFGLVVAGQLAGPNVEGCTYVRGVVGVGCEDQAVAGVGVPDDWSVFMRV